MGVVETAHNLRNVTIRTFEPKDLEAVQSLYLETRIWGDGSPTRLGISRFMLTLPAYASYFGLTLGLCIRSSHRYLGMFLTGVSGLYIAGIAFPMCMFLFNGLKARFGSKGDMRDVAKHYLRDGTASHYWVAEVEGKVVGCVALDALSNSNKEEAELRRMFVSPSCRGLGIAKKLMNTLLDHARSQGLKSVYLQTTWLNDKAVVMYQKTGWELTKKDSFRFMMVKGEGYHFKRDLTEDTWNSKRI